MSESCGKCIPCRAGTVQAFRILDRIIHGQGTLADLDKLQELCVYMREASLCGLGQTAPNPILSTLRFFREEYEAHITEQVCPAGVCPMKPETPLYAAVAGGALDGAVAAQVEGQAGLQEVTA
jgi:hypothetical protein